MIYIKLSAIHKAEIICVTAIMALAVVAFVLKTATGSAKQLSTKSEYNSDTEVSETTGTESYESETQDESIYETTEVQATTETTTVSETQETVTEPEQEETSAPVAKQTNSYYSEQDAIDIAKVLWNECRGVPSVTEQACVAWTVLNRVDKYGSTVHDVVRAPHQFAFYEGTTVDATLLELAKDVLNRWANEKNGLTDVGRVLPKEYTYFEGYGGHNHFRDDYSGNYNLWDYSLPSPYAT